MNAAELLEGKRICICGGSGGVGKTTTSAAIAAGMAARGLKVVVVTIDPARRLASALGLSDLSNEPRRVEPDRFSSAGLELEGELWAMMLDPKRTLDELIARLAPDADARDEVLSNRIYQELSNAVAGSQEFSAIAKLYELDREHDFDLVVLDTPPTRNALDFLDAPTRLTQFFEGRSLGTLLLPTGLGMRIVGRGSGVVFSLLRRLTGVDLLGDLRTFFQALAGLIDGFKERAARVDALLADPATAFLLVSSLEPDPVEETIFFHETLRRAGLPFAGAIVNRVHHVTGGRVEQGRLLSCLTDTLDAPLARRVAANFADYALLAERDRENLAHLSGRLDDAPLILVPFFDDDIHDAAGLVQIHRYLFANDRERAQLFDASIA